MLIKSTGLECCKLLRAAMAMMMQVPFGTAWHSTRKSKSNVDLSDWMKEQSERRRERREQREKREERQKR